MDFDKLSKDNRIYEDNNRVHEDYGGLREDFDKLSKDLEKLRNELWDHLDTVKMVKADLIRYYNEFTELKLKLEKQEQRRKRIRKFLFSLLPLKKLCLKKENQRKEE